MAAKREPQLPPRWAEVMARVEQALNSAIAGADQRAAGSQPQSSTPVDLTEGLSQFRERLRGLMECATRAEQAVASADADLAAGEEALRTWFQTAEGARRKLADWAGRA